MAVLGSGITYLVMFTVTLFCAMINDKNLNRDKPRKLVHIFTALVIILLPAALAGMRASSVGTDTSVYGIPVFNNAISSYSLLSLFDARSDIDYGFLFLAYIVSRFTHNFGWFLFAISTFIQYFVYLALYKSQKTHSILIGEWVYLFLFYNMSLNIMRQSMAMSVLLLFTIFIREKRYITSILLLLFACSFHQTALIGFLYIIVFLIFDNMNQIRDLDVFKKRRTRNTILLLLMIVIGLFVSNSFQNIVISMVGYGLIAEDYLRYLQSSYSFTTQPKLYLLYPIIYISLFLRKEKRYDFMAIAILDIVAFYLQGINFYLYRIATYFMFYRILSISDGKIDYIRILHNKKISKNGLIYMFAILISCICWYYFTGYYNQNDTLPYIFAK